MSHHSIFLSTPMMPKCSWNFSHQQQSAAQPYRVRLICFFSPCSSVKHHYIFITRRQMTETEREEEIWTRQQRRNSSGVFLWDIWLHCLNLPFIYCLVVKTQLCNSYKWTFDLTIHDLIGTLDVPQTSSLWLGGLWERLNLEFNSLKPLWVSILSFFC